jgi:hypothetical protein
MKGWRVAAVAFVAGILVAVPAIVFGATGNHAGALDSQRAAFRTGKISTTSTTFTDIPGLIVLACAKNEVSASVSLGLAGGPAAFQVQIDSGATLDPGSVQFDPTGATPAFSFVWATNAGTFEGSDGHAFTVQWRSVNGQTVSLNRGLLNVQFENGTCP